MEGEGQLEQLRGVAGAGGGGAHGGGEGLGGRAHLGHRLRHPRRVGRLQARDRAQHVGLRGPRARCGRAEDGFHRGEVPFLARDGRDHTPRALVVDPPQLLEQVSPPLGRVLEGLLARSARVLERGLGLHEVLQTEDGGEGVV